MPGIDSVEVNLNSGEVEILAEAARVTPEKVIRVIDQTCDSAHCLSSPWQKCSMLEKSGTVTDFRDVSG